MKDSTRSLEEYRAPNPTFTGTALRKSVNWEMKHAQYSVDFSPKPETIVTITL